jgi:hypothetical protein
MTYEEFVVDGVVFEMYDPATATWTDLTSGNDPLVGFLDEGRIYAIAINDSNVIVGKLFLDEFAQ